MSRPCGSNDARLPSSLRTLRTVYDCLYNERTGRLIDGQARRKVALEQGAELIPVLIFSFLR